MDAQNDRGRPVRDETYSRSSRYKEYDDRSGRYESRESLHYKSSRHDHTRDARTEESLRSSGKEQRVGEDNGARRDRHHHSDRHGSHSHHRKGDYDVTPHLSEDIDERRRHGEGEYDRHHRRGADEAPESREYHSSRRDYESEGRSRRGDEDLDKDYRGRDDGAKYGPERKYTSRHREDHSSQSVDPKDAARTFSRDEEYRKSRRDHRSHSHHSHRHHLTGVSEEDLEPSPAAEGTRTLADTSSNTPRSWSQDRARDKNAYRHHSLRDSHSHAPSERSVYEQKRRGRSSSRGSSSSSDSESDDDMRKQHSASRRRSRYSHRRSRSRSRSASRSRSRSRSRSGDRSRSRSRSRSKDRHGKNENGKKRKRHNHSHRSDSKDKKRKRRDKEKERDKGRDKSRKKDKERKEEERRSVLTGKKIKLKVKQDKDDIEREKNRKDLLMFLNSAL
ncbi:hypothetical protein BDN70DRAFT_918768 [Pholiota conissans]|uniref:Uncharacterized protein n=1 Tax=Pholiota conissans TaxID=109636 RepID=A0A9P5Z7E4_9AGAR|nr:hypothetical protein BDN70DRAFT_918768 [Pholiota conissans]